MAKKRKKEKHNRQAAGNICWLLLLEFALRFFFSFFLKENRKWNLYSFKESTSLTVGQMRRRTARQAYTDSQSPRPGNLYGFFFFLAIVWLKVLGPSTTLATCNQMQQYTGIRSIWLIASWSWVRKIPIGSIRIKG